MNVRSLSDGLIHDYAIIMRMGSPIYIAVKTRPDIESRWDSTGFDLSQTPIVQVGSAAPIDGAVGAGRALPTSRGVEIRLNSGGRGAPRVLVRHGSTQHQWGLRVEGRGATHFLGTSQATVLLPAGATALAGFIGHSPDADERVLAKVTVSQGAVVASEAPDPTSSGYAQAQHTFEVARTVREGIASLAGGFLAHRDETSAQNRKAYALALCSVLDAEIDPGRAKFRETLALKQILRTSGNGDYLASGLYSFVVGLVCKAQAIERRTATSYLSSATGIGVPSTDDLRDAKKLARQLAEIGALPDRVLAQARSDWAGHVLTVAVIPNDPALRAALTVVAAEAAPDRPGSLFEALAGSDLTPDAVGSWRRLRQTFGNPLIDGLELNRPQEFGVPGLLDLAEQLVWTGAIPQETTS